MLRKFRYLLLNTARLAEVHGHDDPGYKGGEEDEEDEEEGEVEPVRHQGSVFGVKTRVILRFKSRRMKLLG